MSDMAVKSVKKNLRLEKREYKYLLREFYELKRIFSSIQEIERVKDRDVAGVQEYVQSLIQAILQKLRTEERIDRRMARAYQRMRESLDEVKEEFAQTYPEEVKKFEKLIGDAEVFNADLVKLGSRGGQIEKALKQAKDYPKKLDTAFDLIKRSLSDARGFEAVIDELMHIDLVLLQKKKLEESDLSAELENIAEADQASRTNRKLTGAYATMKDMGEVDVYNANRLKQLGRLHNIRTKEDFAKLNLKDMNNVFIVVQHSDHDVDFQKTMFDWFKYVEWKRGKKGSQDVALLTDRIRVNTRKSQEYASQAAEFPENMEGPVWQGIFALFPVRGARVTEWLTYTEPHYGRTIKYGPLTEDSIRKIDERRAGKKLQPIRKYYFLLAQKSKKTAIAKFYLFSVFRRSRLRQVLMYKDFKAKSG
jgi:hypothetical protein